MSQRPPRSFLKWAGGKRKIIPYILQGMEELGKLGEDWRLAPGQQYHEPFLGSGSVFFAFKQANIIPQQSHSFLSDLNQVLTTTMRTVQSPNITELKAELEQMRAAYLEEIRQDGFPSGMTADERNQRMYYQKRARMNQLISLLQKGGQLNYDQSLELASLMIFINKTCFNGLFRVNSKGGFNVPYGYYKNPSFVNEDNLRAVSKALQCAVITCQPYDALSLEAKENFVYFDPPYRPLTTSSSFTAYSKSGFNDDNQRELANFVTKISPAACIMLSNSDPKNTNENDLFFDELYDEFTIDRIMAPRSINSDGEGRGKIPEILVTNY